MLGSALVLVPLTGYLGIAVLMATVIGTAEASRLSLGAALVVALPGWLALHHVPLSIEGAPLSIFPLLPTGLMIALLATASARVAERAQLTRPDQARWIVLPMALVHALIGAVLASWLEGPLGTRPGLAFLHCGVTALVAATLGVAGPCGLTHLVRSHIRVDVWTGLRVGVSVLAGMVVAGALAMLAGLLASLPELGSVIRAAGSAGDAYGLVLLSLLYLPNALLAGWSFATGNGLSIGAIELSPFATTSGEFPAVPLFALIPSGDGWGAVLVLVLPVLLGGWCGRRCLRSGQRAWPVFGVAVGVAALGTGLLAGLAGGELGGAAFGPVTLRPGLLAAATFGWIAVSGAIVIALRGAAYAVPHGVADDAEDGIAIGARVEPESLATDGEDAERETTADSGWGEDESAEEGADEPDQEESGQDESADDVAEPGSSDGPTATDAEDSIIDLDDDLDDLGEYSAVEDPDEDLTAEDPAPADPGGAEGPVPEDPGGAEDGARGR
ncbi:DUF6350 family protein [Parasphingorhabdus pacifica]